MRRVIFICPWLLLLTGCGHGVRTAKLNLSSEPVVAQGAPTAAVLSNPLYVPPINRDFLWDQIVDTIDDYFRIERERRVQEVGGVLTDGRLDTYPTIGSTLLEPWRKDSTPGYERLHATLQSIRRQASVMVTPDPQGYFVEVIVDKQLEAVDQPEHSSEGTATFRHDNSLTSRRAAKDKREGRSFTIGWTSLGRDVSLEQQILQEIRARVADVSSR